MDNSLVKGLMQQKGISQKDAEILLGKMDALKQLIDGKRNSGNNGNGAPPMPPKPNKNGKNGQNGQNDQPGKQDQNGQNDQPGKPDQNGQNGQDGQNGQGGQNGQNGQNGPMSKEDRKNLQDKLNQLKDAIKDRESQLNDIKDKISQAMAGDATGVADWATSEEEKRKANTKISKIKDLLNNNTQEKVDNIKKDLEQIKYNEERAEAEMKRAIASKKSTTSKDVAKSITGVAGLKGMTDFDRQLKKCIAKQVGETSTTVQTYTHPNKKALALGQIRPGEFTSSHQNKSVPSIYVYVDQSFSWVGQPQWVARSMQIIKSLRDKYEKKHLIKTFLYGFDTRCAPYGEKLGGGTRAEPVLRNIIDNKPDNVIIITDADTSYQPPIPVTVKGAVFMLFKDGISRCFIDSVTGKMGSFYYDLGKDSANESLEYDAPVDDIIREALESGIDLPENPLDDSDMNSDSLSEGIVDQTNDQFCSVCGSHLINGSQGKYCPKCQNQNKLQQNNNLNQIDYQQNITDNNGIVKVESLKESLRQIDKDTFNRFTLTTLFESCDLDKKDCYHVYRLLNNTRALYEYLYYRSDLISDSDFYNIR